jgi:Ca2+-binding RTX toxin-like protein
MHRLIARLALAAPAVMILAAVVSAVATANTVPSSNIAEQVAQAAISADDLKPAICNALTLTTLVLCTGGICNGSTGNDLMLGTAGADTLKGKGGNDCLIAGGGADTIQGNAGTDVCDGGPGIDSQTSCATTYNIP